MDLMIYVTETDSDLIYKLDPHTKTQLQGKTKIPASKVHIGVDTKSDFAYYHGEFENSQLPSMLTGLTCEELKKNGFDHLVYYRTQTGARKNIDL